MIGSIFLDFNLPNAATWFYFSLLLAVALFFKFSRLLSMRNWDVVTLFVLVPGLLLLHEARTSSAAPENGSNGANGPPGEAETPPAAPARLLWLGYLWLLGGSGYFLIRCLLDLALVRRPALSPNLNLAGLAWLGGALFICLIAVAARRPVDYQQKVGKESAPLAETQRRAVELVNQGTGAGKHPSIDTRFWVERGLAILCHLVVLAGLVFIGWWHFQDVSAGMAAATFYLLLPYTAYHVEQLHHAWPMAFLLWAIAAYRLPVLAGLLFGLAAGSVYFPVLAFPAWFSFYWRRGAGRFAAGFLLAAGLSLAVTGFILWLDGDLARSLQSVLDLSDWQPWKVPSTEGFWTGIHWAYRIPVFIAYLAFVVTTAFWPAPKNLAHLLALTAAVLIGIQFWYADHGGVYVLWYLPLLLLLVFRPNLVDRQPAPIPSESDWLARLGRTIRRRSARLFRFPEPVARVS